MITTVSTVKDEPARLHRWVDRNLAAGVDRMVVFVDDPADVALAEELDSRPGVVAVGARWWWGERRAGKLNVRQRVNSNAALDVLTRADPTGWVFHIDGDEVIHLDKAQLLALPDDVTAVQLATLEAVSQWEWPDDEVAVFKRLLSDEELNLLHLLGRLERPDNSYYFRGHITGKAGLRLGTDGAWLGIHRVVDADREALPGHSADWLQLLHYESHTYAEFVRKWTNLVGSGPPVVARHNRGRLGSAMRAPQWLSWPADVADEVRRELFARTSLDDRDALDRLGLLVEPRTDRRHDAASGDLRLDAVRAGLREAATRDKTPYRLAGRDDDR